MKIKPSLLRVFKYTIPVYLWRRKSLITLIVPQLRVNHALFGRRDWCSDYRAHQVIFVVA